MKESFKDVAESWARWVAADIMSELTERDLIFSDDAEKIEEVLFEHLTDVALCNAIRNVTESNSGDRGT